MVFPSQDVASLSPAPRAPRAAQYMAEMGLWRPQTGPECVDSGPGLPSDLVNCYG